MNLKRFSVTLVFPNSVPKEVKSLSCLFGVRNTVVTEYYIT